MPNYDWQCAAEHTFEKFLLLSKWKDKMRIPCEKAGCNEEAHQVVLPRGSNTTIQPFVYYLNAQGEIRIPGSSNLPTPKGHTRCEATTLAEVRQLERKCAISERSKIAQSKEVQDYYNQQESEADRRELRSAMENMSEAGKDFARKAMERSNQKRDFKSHDPGYHFQVLHQDERTGRREYEG